MGNIQRHDAGVGQFAAQLGPRGIGAVDGLGHENTHVRGDVNIGGNFRVHQNPVNRRVRQVSTDVGPGAARVGGGIDVARRGAGYLLEADISRGGVRGIHRDAVDDPPKLGKQARRNVGPGPPAIGGNIHLGVCGHCVDYLGVTLGYVQGRDVVAREIRADGVPPRAARGAGRAFPHPGRSQDDRGRRTGHHLEGHEKGALVRNGRVAHPVGPGGPVIGGD